ncbi:Lecithin:cholesterol/phospholipid:diacylglycerol acyltransferase [Dillenia turbinata]|uniref:Lecithin:cholesterol/phospholipid:diacylglycerol acyltransferase n=1 Tax=Dillenia turbinata TaxID=194707 RepID=A0AAN8Z183_9MAGN
MNKRICRVFNKRGVVYPVWYEETLKHLAEKLESVYTASGGKKINIISHSMGGLLVKCFMCLHSDIFEKYVKNWIAIAAPFRGEGAPGYVTSTFLNGMSFVEGWEQNFFISKWSMHQLLIECPSAYELMGCPNFQWEHSPVLEIWREKHNSEGSFDVVLESYPPMETISVFCEALSSNTVNYHGESIPLPFNLEILKWANETRRIMSAAKVPPSVKFYNIYGISVETPHSVCYGSKEAPVSDLKQLPFFQATYICVDGDGTVPSESAKLLEAFSSISFMETTALDLFRYLNREGERRVNGRGIKADGLDAEARVGIPGEHRGILWGQHLFRMLKHWLKVGDPDPYYNPLNDFVILPTAFEIERHREKGYEVASLKEEWEIISPEQNDRNIMNMYDGKPLVSSIIVAQGEEKECQREKAHATVTVHPPHEGKQHIELNAVNMTLDG